MADPGGPIKTIFFGEAASDSGSFGFSEACPLVCQCQHHHPPQLCVCEESLPSSPDCVHIHSFCHIYDQFHVGVVVVIGSAGYLDVLIRHPDVVCICLQILWGGHDGELYGPLIAKGLVCPFSYRPDLLDCCNTIVGNQNLAFRGGLALHTTPSTHPRPNTSALGE